MIVGLFFSQEDDTVEVNDNNSAFELLEYEAAKNASDSFVKEGVSNTSKVVVLSMILKNFLEQESVTEKETFEDGKDFDKNDSYKLLISSVRGGLEAASLIGKGINVSNESLPGAACESYQSESVDSRRRNALLVELWDRVEQMLSSMLSQHETGSHTRFMGRTDAILEILSSCILYVPERSHENLALVLSEGALYAITVAKFERYPDQIVDDLCKDSLQVFEECIIGLGKCDPNSSILREIAENALRDILVSSLPKKENDWNSSLTENRQRNTDFQEEVEIEIALIVCEVLRTGSKHLTDLVIFIFPWLCKLTNIDEERIRKRAGLVLGSVDLSRFIARKTEAVREAEQCAREAKVMNEKLLNELNEIKVENERLRKEISRL